MYILIYKSLGIKNILKRSNCNENLITDVILSSK